MGLDLDLFRGIDVCAGGAGPDDDAPGVSISVGRVIRRII